MCENVRWRRIVKPAFIAVYCISLMIALPFTFIELYKKSSPSNVVAWFIGGLFVMGAVPISIWTILEHLLNYTQPFLQRHIIRILWMVPIYALDAWFALKFPKSAIYFNTLRECYEAYVIYNFMAFVLNFLRFQHPDLGYVIEQKDQVYHMMPLCCLAPWPMGKKFLEICRRGAMQYVILRPITTIVAFICAVNGAYDEGNYTFGNAFIYLLIINNLSQIWAMYCLIMLYKCTKEELRPMNPVAKFICVKFVVFMSFWQAILISILTAAGVIQKVEAWKLYDTKLISLCLQNFAICIEMFIAAVAHHIAFTAKPYIHQRPSNPEEPRFDTQLPNSTHQRQSLFTSLKHMWDISDVRKDVLEHVRHVGSSMRNLRRHDMHAGTDNVALLRDEKADQFDDSEHNPSSFVKQPKSRGVFSLSNSDEEEPPHAVL